MFFFLNGNRSITQVGEPVSGERAVFDAVEKAAIAVLADATHVARSWYSVAVSPYEYFHF